MLAPSGTPLAISCVVQVYGAVVIKGSLFYNSFEEDSLNQESLTMVSSRRPRPSLFIYGEPARTPFALLGRHERAITFAFGYTLYMCPRLLLELLSHIGYERPDRIYSSINRSKVLLEQADEFGRTDAEIYVPPILHLIVEGKRGRNYPELKQLDRYLKRLKSDDECDKKLWIVADREDIGHIADNYRQRRKAFRDGLVELSSFSWEEITEACSSLLKSGTLPQNDSLWLKRFLKFVKWERYWTIKVSDLENPLRDEGLQLLSEIKKLRDDNHWLLSRQPKADLLAGSEPWMAFVSNMTGRNVFGIQADKKRVKWYVWFSLPKSPQELGIKLRPQLMRECEWQPEAKECHVTVTKPRADVRDLEALFRAAYNLVNTP